MSREKVVHCVGAFPRPGRPVTSLGAGCTRGGSPALERSPPTPRPGPPRPARLARQPQRRGIQHARPTRRPRPGVKATQSGGRSGRSDEMDTTRLPGELRRRPTRMPKLRRVGYRVGRRQARQPRSPIWASDAALVKLLLQYSYYLPIQKQITNPRGGVKPITKTAN